MIFTVASLRCDPLVPHFRTAEVGMWQSCGARDLFELQAVSMEMIDCDGPEAYFPRFFFAENKWCKGPTTPFKPTIVFLRWSTPHSE